MDILVIGSSEEWIELRHRFNDLYVDCFDTTYQLFNLDYESDYGMQFILHKAMGCRDDLMDISVIDFSKGRDDIADIFHIAFTPEFIEEILSNFRQTDEIYVSSRTI
jgi:hypothetical protein